MIIELRKYINKITFLSDKSYFSLEKLFVQKKLRKGELFCHDGEISKEIGFLEDGILRGYYRASNGTEYNKHFFVNSCFIGGYASLITGNPNQIIQEALTDCTIWVANYKAFQQLFEEYQDVERLARKLAEYFFVQKEQREIDIVLLDADKRYLLFLKEFPGLGNVIPQYHIASYLGITPTQLSRIRKKIVKS
ncbi:Crp/Fnr family transcriptional regulator [Empedobacter sedimenti]|uniref:Crp/Fnr family transcriptional regulator n=1 Tax=Empedobacter sedimenti TaxID=3042610 RepID=UPI0024A62DB6|nr:Crp/Fnr family transcriptional regulator [Empedobacter sedimenti]